MKKIALTFIAALATVFSFAQDLKTGTIVEKNLISLDGTDAQVRSIWAYVGYSPSAATGALMNVYEYQIKDANTGEIVSSFATEMDLPVGVMVDYILTTNGSYDMSWWGKCHNASSISVENGSVGSGVWGDSNGITETENTLTNVQKSKHDAAMAVIQNTR